MKYESIPETIVAEVYRPGLEDGIGYFTKVPYIYNNEDLLYVSKDDFIITHTSGMKSVMSPTEFHAKYREVNE